MSKLIITNCEQCGKEFPHWPSQPRKFCRRECHAAWMSQHQRGQKNPYWKKERTFIMCLVCQKPIRVYPSNQKTKKTCSRQCDSIWRKTSGIASGENNPAYKGGTVEYKNSRSGRRYRYLRGKQGSRKRPEHRVVMAQHLGRPLETWEEVHHINGDGLDNRIENLYLVDKKHHTRLQFELFKRVQKLEQENQRLKKIISSLQQSSFVS